ncbi:metalloregulator ArsR/SmtB family transcription factor [Halomonas salinarum]|uniref:metalloregulator ArsR/SmtB family transcription factor n=1 Tax=Halomonas salinarum TaxID=1158993 RepID=UPI003CC91905
MMTGRHAVTPTRLHKCLADETRLLLTLLIHAEGELCVCEMLHALKASQPAASQPKVSRHLALLRDGGLLEDRRQGQWVYYRLAPDLPAWAERLIAASAEGAEAELAPLQRCLATMGNRPTRQAACC